MSSLFSSVSTEFPLLNVSCKCGHTCVCLTHGQYYEHALCVECICCDNSYLCGMSMYFTFCVTLPSRM